MTPAEARARIRPGTWRAVEAARRVYTAKGRWPTPKTLLTLARAEGGDPDAVIVLCRHELPRLANRYAAKLMRLDSPRARGVEMFVPTPETAYALIAAGRPVLATLMSVHDLPTGTPYTFHRFVFVTLEGREVGRRAAAHP